MFTLDNGLAKKELLCTSHHVGEESELHTNIGSNQLANDMVYSHHLCIGMLHCTLDAIVCF